MKRSIALLLTLTALVGGTLACGQRSTSPALPTSTPGPTPTPLPVLAPGWENVTLRTLCLAVEQSYPEVEGKQPEPIAQAAQELLTGLGLQVVAEGAACEATLTLSVTGQALSDDYLGLEGGHCYSGAEVEGQMVLTAPGREPLTWPISGRQGPPSRIEYCPKEPVDAPFNVAWWEALLKGLTDGWSPQVLAHALSDERVLVRALAAEALIELGPEAAVAVPALIQTLLEDTDADVRASAVQALREIGPAAIEAVPALIQALGDADSRVSRFTVGALKDITGQDLGQNATAWEKWWEKRPTTAGETPEAQSATPAFTATPAGTHNLTPTRAGCLPNAAFAGDVTIPDGTCFDPGASFSKVWRIRSNGCAAWPSGTRWGFVSGSQMGAPDGVDVPDTPLNQTADLAVPMQAPPQPGAHKGYWQMEGPDGVRFGDRVWVSIVVGCDD